MRDGPDSLRYLTSLGLACVLPCILSACGDPSADRPRSDHPPAEAAVRDSAGVAIVEHGRIDLAGVPEWRLAAEPEVEVGRVAGDPRYLLHEVRDAMRRDDGSVVAVVGSEVRAYGPDGTFLWSQGSEGQGPGAYMGASTLAPTRGDSVLVWDQSLRRLTVLSPEGELGRTLTPDLGRFLYRIGTAGPDAFSLLEVWSDPAPDAITTELTTRRQFMAVRMIDLDGTLVDSWGPGLRYIEYVRSFALSEPPWAGSVFAVPARDGTPGVWWGDSRVPAAEVRLLRTGEEVERIVRWSADRTVSNDDREEYRRWYLGWTSELEDQRRRVAHRELLPLLPWPDRFPAYDRIMTDRAGRLWVAEYLREDRVEDDDPQRWTIFSADGRRVLGWYAAPQRWDGFVVKDIGGDWMLVLERDELEVEHLRLYRIVKDG